MSAASSPSKRLEAAAWGSSWNSSRKGTGALRVRQWSSSSPSRWRPGTWCQRCWRGSQSFSGKAPVDLACPHFTPWLARLSMYLFHDWLVYTMFYAMIGLFTHVLCHDWLMYLCFMQWLLVSRWILCHDWPVYLHFTPQLAYLSMFWCLNDTDSPA